MKKASGHRKSILFDMDGTLIDPSEGIFDSLRYAFDQLNVPQPPDGDFDSFIGPPLRLIFSRTLGTNDVDLLENAVALYRQRYGDTGIYQCMVYPGILDMLQGLCDDGLDLYVATIKPGPYARKILNHTGLASYFRAIHGSDMDGSLDDKGRLVKGLLSDHRLKAAETIMVGDRYMDVEAAEANGLISIGVSYGFGTRQELEDAGADQIADSPREVLNIIEAIEKNTAIQ